MTALVPLNANAIAPQFTIADLERVALAIAKGGLFGSKDPNAVLTLCLLAQAEGKHPALVMQDYHVISGKPAKKADAMLRDFITAGGKVKWHELSDERADATFTHPSGEARIDWDMARARSAGINNPMWKKYPRQMLRSRVISEGVRTVFPGATSGLYEVSEMQDAAEENKNPALEAQEGGLIEGQFEERAVSPDEPADDTQAKKGWREPESIYTTPTKLHAATSSLRRELEGCGDSDMVYALTATDEWREFVRISEKHAPHYLRGGDPAPPEFEGLLDVAERMVREFDSATAQHMTDIARA